MEHVLPLELSNKFERYDLRPPPERRPPAMLLITVMDYLELAASTPGRRAVPSWTRPYRMSLVCSGAAASEVDCLSQAERRRPVYTATGDGGAVPGGHPCSMAGSPASSSFWTPPELLDPAGGDSSRGSGASQTPITTSNGALKVHGSPKSHPELPSTPPNLMPHDHNS